MRNRCEGDRVYLRPLERTDASALLRLRERNRDFLKPFEPAMSDTHFTHEGQQQSIEQAIVNWNAGTGYSFGIFVKASDSLIGRVTLSNVVRGAWHSCTIGYFLDEAENGNGYTTEAVRLIVKYAFEEIGLHRVQGAVMPRNGASVRVLEKVGFAYEGLAKYYLQINGVWEDHNIYSITRELWK